MKRVLESGEPPKPWAWRFIQTIFNVINHSLIVIVTIYMSYLTYNSIKYEVDRTLKILHAFLCTIGVRLFAKHFVWFFTYDLA